MPLVEGGLDPSIIRNMSQAALVNAYENGFISFNTALAELKRRGVSDATASTLLGVPYTGEDDIDPDYIDPGLDPEIRDDEEVTLPDLPIDPSGTGDVIDIIQSSETDFIWTEIPTPNFDTEPSPFLFNSSGQVTVSGKKLYAKSDESKSSQFYLQSAANTRLTMSVRLEYSNKAVDRSTILTNDWAEEFDLILEDGDSISWDVPKQDKSGVPPWYGIKDPVRGSLGILIAGSQRIDQTAPIQTYHEVKGGTWKYRARGRMTIEIALLKYEVGEEISDDPTDVTDPTDPTDPTDIFATSDILLGLGVMLLLGVYVISKLQVNTPNPLGTPAVA